MSKWYITANGRKRKINDSRCGTPSGWKRHMDAGEKPCEPCTLAKRDYDSDWRSQPEPKLRNRLSAKAQMAAHKALSHKYKAEYDALYAAEKARLFAEHGMTYIPRGGGSDAA